MFCTAMRGGGGLWILGLRGSLRGRRPRRGLGGICIFATPYTVRVLRGLRRMQSCSDMVLWRFGLEMGDGTAYL